MSEIALITGISGQDGSYLAELLLSKGYEVHGMVRRASIEDPDNRLVNIKQILNKLKLHVVSIDNYMSIYNVVKEIQPNQCYHMAASSFVNYSFDNEINVLDTNFYATYYLLTSLRDSVPNCKLFFAGSSEMFGNVTDSPQDENTPFFPRSIYGISKLASYHLLRNFREKYNMFACTGFLYNHESPRRSFEYVTRKITSNVAKIKLGLEDKLLLGNLEALRDWGYAPDYVYAMWLMLQQTEPDDYILSTGATTPVKRFVEYAFNYVNLDYQQYVVFDERFYRPTESIPLCGNFTKAQKTLGWQHTKCLKEIVEEMVDSDLNLFSRC